MRFFLIENIKINFKKIIKKIISIIFAWKSIILFLLEYIFIKRKDKLKNLGGQVYETRKT